MKKILLAISIFNLLLLSFYLLAHFNYVGIKLNGPPIPGNLPDPGTDPDTVPINQYEWFLTVIGLVYVFYKVRAVKLR